ncbi:MAG: glycosyltransferase family 2 protein [Bacteroidia bacterium]|jgi:GT2 family glycosyltransferase
MKVAVCIVFYDDLEHLQRLAISLNELDYKNFSVFFLDNDIHKKHTETFKKFFPSATEVYGQGNLGFASGNNRLFEVAIRNNCDAFWVLNPDMYPLQNSLTELMNLLINYEDAAAVGPIVLYGDSITNPIIQVAGIRINFSTQKKVNLHAGVAISEIAQKTPYQVDSLNGGSLLIRAACFKGTPIFEEMYFMYNDEIDLMRRIRVMKKSVWVCPTSLVFHYHNWHRNNEIGYHRMYFYMMRNKFLYWKKYGHYTHFLLGLIKNIVLFPIIARFCYRTAGFRLIKFYYWGVLHGCFGKSGKSDIKF